MGITSYKLKNMNKIFNFITSLFMITMFMVSCSPDEYKLNAPDLKSEDLVEGIAYKIEHDKDNPNIVYLTNLKGNGYTPVWIHPQGRSQEQKVTLKLPFPGTYEITFGLETQGGIVYGEKETFTIDEFYPDFVTDELWTMLTGGLGKSKTWVHDNGSYGLASGEMDYADPSEVVEWNNFKPNWGPGKGHTEDDNIWKSTMTFTLNGGAFVETHDESKVGAVDHKGTFMLDTDNHTITLNDAEVIHTQGWGSKATNWNKGLKVLTLTENQLQIAVLRDASPGEADWWLIWNYVSKDYADNYVPEDKADPVPPIDGNVNDVLTTTKSKVWKLSKDAPYDWADLNGNLVNNFSAKNSYISTGWAAYSENMIDATKLTFLASDATKGKFVFSSFGNNDLEGTYEVDNNNDITFSTPLSAIISETNFGWNSIIKLETTTESKLRLLKTKTDVFGSVTDIWLAKRLTERDEYMVYHFKLDLGVEEDKAISVPVDNTKLDFGDLENIGNLRIELYNEYGSTKNNPPVDPSKFNFSNSLTVTFTINGITLKSGAIGSYTTGISYADDDWYPNYWGGGEGDTTVTGDGTYTVSFTPEASASGIKVFTIDMKGLGSDIVDLSTVSIVINKIELR